MSTNTSTTLEYVDTSLGIQGFESTDIQNLDEINALYMSSLLAPNETQRSPKDAWGNVKIPLIEALEEASSEGWNIVNASWPGDASYSSMLGVPTTKIPEVENTEFYVESTYSAFDCQSLFKGQWPLFVYSGNTSFIAPKDTFYLTWRYEEPTQVHPHWTANLSFGALYSAEDGPVGSFANCQVTRSYVESQVECKWGDCAVGRIRRSPKPDAAIFNQSSISIDYPMLKNYLFRFRMASGVPHPGQATITERYLWDPETPFVRKDKFFLPIADLPIEVFTRRLALLLNTYWQAALASSYQTTGLPDDVASMKEWYTPHVKIANATITKTHGVWACSYLWLTIMLLSSIILVITAIVGAVLGFFTNTPDILGYVSSMTKAIRIHRCRPVGVLSMGSRELDYSAICVSGWKTCRRRTT